MDDYDVSFSTVEAYIKNIELTLRVFVEEELAPYFRETLIQSAYENVYAVYEPIMYDREFTLMNRNYYGSHIETNNSSGLYDSVVYVYSKSPHARIVANGYPYNYPFEYNGVSRPFGEKAEEMVSKDIKAIKSKMVAFLNSEGIEAH